MIKICAIQNKFLKYDVMLKILLWNFLSVQPLIFEASHLWFIVSINQIPLGYYFPLRYIVENKVHHWVESKPLEPYTLRTCSACTRQTSSSDIINFKIRFIACVCVHSICHHHLVPVTHISCINIHSYIYPASIHTISYILHTVQYSLRNILTILLHTTYIHSH